jgi:hypothetical protein
MPFVDHASSLYSELVGGPAAHVPRSAPIRYIDALPPPHGTEQETDRPCNQLEESDKGD